MSAEGFRGKIFDTESIAALGCALVDKASVLRTEAVKFFIAAIAQGVLHCFRGLFIPKYLQRALGTRYLISRPSLHLDVH